MSSAASQAATTASELRETASRAANSIAAGQITEAASDSLRKYATKIELPPVDGVLDSSKGLLQGVQSDIASKYSPLMNTEKVSDSFNVAFSKIAATKAPELPPLELSVAPLEALLPASSEKLTGSFSSAFEKVCRRGAERVAEHSAAVLVCFADRTDCY